MLELVVGGIDAAQFAQEVAALVSINARSSYAHAPTKEEHWKTCGSQIAGDMGLDPAILGSCSFGSMVLGTCVCVAPWCTPSDVHSNVDFANHVRTIMEQFKWRCSI